jgi:hypothetical protein
MDWRVVGRLVRRAGVDGRLRTFKQRGSGDEGEGRRGSLAVCQGYLPGSWAGEGRRAGGRWDC